MTDALPPLPAIGRARIEIFSVAEGSAKWDTALWDRSVWPKVDWRDITPQSMVAKITWGADDPSGVLTVPAAGSWTIETYDPLRLLDPSNGASPYAVAIRPGKPIRLTYINAAAEKKIVRQGLIDEIDFNLTTLKGTLRGTDQVQLLVGAHLPEGQHTDPNMPNTLRARAQYVINKAGLGTLVPVEPTPVDEVDPPVGKVIEREATVWNIILTAAYDALYATWMDRNGHLRFRSFGNPRDAGFQAGGADGIPISDMRTQGSLQSVFTRIITFDNSASPGQPVEAFDQNKASIYGDILLKREQQVPNARAWVDSVLADRSGASLQYSPGTLYPQTEDALESILDLGMVDIAHLVAESVDPSIDVAARVLGGTLVADTSTGWTAELVTYIPAKEWEEAEQPTPPPIEPPPSTISGVVRTYSCTKDSRLAHSSSLDAGNGTDVQLPIGYISPYRNRAVLDFADIPFGGVVSIDKAELVVKIGTNSCGSFGTEPKVNVSRITGGWSEGSVSTACGFATSNSVKYPGPAITSSGSVTTTVPKSTGSEKSIDITAIARAWLAGNAQNGVMVKSAGEDSSKYTTCFYSRHHGTSGNRPFLRLTLTVAA
jgi:hypothetical protein